MANAANITQSELTALVTATREGWTLEGHALAHGEEAARKLRMDLETLVVEGYLAVGHTEQGRTFAATLAAWGVG